MQWRMIGLVGASLLICPAALGATSGYSPTYDACIAKSGSVDSKMGSCAYEEADRQDKALNATYRKLTAVLEPEEKALLTKAERAWVAFRDAECAFDSSSAAGGTAERVLDANCKLKMTFQRDKDLKRYLESHK